MTPQQIPQLVESFQATQALLRCSGRILVLSMVRTDSVITLFLTAVGPITALSLTLTLVLSIVLVDVSHSGMVTL